MTLKVAIDRETHCPFLLKVFCNVGSHHRYHTFLSIFSVSAKWEQIRGICFDGGHSNRSWASYLHLVRTCAFIAKLTHSLLTSRPDATLREIADLIHDSTEEARKPNIRMGFSIVYPDHRGRYRTSQNSYIASFVACRYIMRKAGWVYTNRRKSIEEDKTLAQIGFQPGDFLDIALLS